MDQDRAALEYPDRGRAAAVHQGGYLGIGVGGDEAGAELVANLSALYDYITQRLMYANLRNDSTLLDEVDRLLDSISSAWREIDPQKSSSMPEASNGHITQRFSVEA